jgi:hypothetical protein
MRALALLALFAFAAASMGDVYVVQHRRPSLLLSYLVPGLKHGEKTFRVVGDGSGLVMRGVTLIADDKASTITIEGSPAFTADVQRILAEFDVEPRIVTVRFRTQNIEDKYTSETTTQVSNNAPWQYRDGRGGVNLEVQPRINGDGTITGQITFEDPKRITVVVRLKNMESMVFGFEGGYLFQQNMKTQSWSRVETGGKTTAVQSPPSVVVSVRFDLEPSPSINPSRR